MLQKKNLEQQLYSTLLENCFQNCFRTTGSAQTRKPALSLSCVFWLGLFLFVFCLTLGGGDGGGEGGGVEKRGRGKNKIYHTIYQKKSRNLFKFVLVLRSRELVSSVCRIFLCWSKFILVFLDFYYSLVLFFYLCFGFLDFFLLFIFLFFLLLIVLECSWFFLESLC